MVHHSTQRRRAASRIETNIFGAKYLVIAHFVVGPFLGGTSEALPAADNVLAGGLIAEQ